MLSLHHDSGAGWFIILNLLISKCTNAYQYMSLIIITQGKDVSSWVKALKEKRPDLALSVYPDVPDAAAVEGAIVWNHPLGVFKEFPNLKWISSMGAGVDHVLKDPELPEAAVITRITDENLTNDMATFTLALVLNHLRGLSFYKVLEHQQTWKRKRYQRIEETTVGVMGTGVLGAAVARLLKQTGFNVNGWARTPKDLDGVKVYVGEKELSDFLSRTDVLVCLLPLTKETRNILNKRTLEQLPQEAFVINVARGEHLVEEDLIEMLDKGHLSGASLDVFRQEPLPQDHIFWKHPKINITPHIASVTDPNTAVNQVLDNYDRLQNMEQLLNVVSLTKGY